MELALLVWVIDLLLKTVTFSEVFLKTVASVTGLWIVIGAMA